MTDTAHPKNGNILCAQIAMILDTRNAAVTCRNDYVHVQIEGGIFFQFETLQCHWSTYSFERLRKVCEDEYVDRYSDIVSSS